MLVIMRHKGEEINLKVRGVNILIVPITIGDKKVRLGIEAPAEVEIERPDCIKGRDEKKKQ